jgi:alkylation response protein AidB-like acyl-CoA dehydrogenase
MTADDGQPGYARHAVEVFAAELHEFLAAVMAEAGEHTDPADLTGLDEPFERRVLGAAGTRGVLGIGLPDEVPAGPWLRAAFDFAVAAHDAPLVDTAVTLAGFSVAAFADEEQRAFFLPRMTGGELTMCVAYSEREAGSDLRALSATAVEDGGGYLLSGVKTLVTGAHKADWCCTVARTGPPGSAAMTMFLVDMAAPGVRVVRRPTMNGWTLDEVHFDAVRLPPGAVLGQPGRAWRQLAAALRAERSGMFHLGFARRALDELRRHLRETGGGDPVARDAFAALEVDFTAGVRLACRALSADRGSSEAVAQASMAKVFATELLQRIAQEATEAAGHQGMVHAPLFAPEPPPAAAGGRFAWEYLERVHGTIGAGANELQRDTIAQAGLGLPTVRRK